MGSFKKKNKLFVTSKSVLTRVMQDLGIDERLREMEMMDLWKEVAGEKLASKTYAHRMTKDKRMVVGVSSSALANELQFLKANLEKKFNELAELKVQRKVRGIIFELRDEGTKREVPDSLL